MSAHPSEDFTATCLRDLGWMVRQNHRVKLTRNWTDIDVLATPLTTAQPPAWLVGRGPPLAPQLVQVKWRNRARWDLSKCTPEHFVGYALPEKHDKVLHEARELCGAAVDWTFVGTRIWITDGAAAGKLAARCVELLRDRKIGEDVVRAVHICCIEDVLAHWIQHRKGDWLTHQAGGWADDPYNFLADLLVRSGTLHPPKAPPPPSDADPLQVALKEWGEKSCPDITSTGPLAPVHAWLGEVCAQAGFPPRGTVPYRSGHQKNGHEGVYASLSAASERWAGVARGKKGQIWVGESKDGAWTGLYHLGPDATSITEARDKLLKHLAERPPEAPLPSPEAP
jgi:hypothetical protein